MSDLFNRIKSVFSSKVISSDAPETDYIKHYGTKRHSGRYPWGSGENPYQRENMDFLARESDLRKKGISEIDIAKQMGCVKPNGEGDTAALRAKKAIANAEIRQEKTILANKLRYEKQMSISAIAEYMDEAPTTVRSLLDPERADRNKRLMETADSLKEVVQKKGIVDVGKGVNQSLDVTEDKLKKSLYILKEQGYNVYTLKVKQQGTGHYTDTKVLCGPDVTYGDAYKALQEGKVKAVDEYTIKDTDGRTILGMLPPKSVDSSRMKVRYAEDGGKMKDGVIELRRGVEDLCLGEANYAQVRIAVDGTHYLKGMAMYSDNMPDGIDIIFNTNKTKDVPILGPDKDHSVLKPLKADKDNPFGATIKQEKPEGYEGDSGTFLKMVQQYYIDKDGNKQQSCINVVNEQGDWGGWSKSLASQFLSKQPDKVAEKQLNLTIANKNYEFEEIKSLTQPEVKAKLLEDFAGSCDSDAVHLKAAALPRQASKVILPSLDLKENECYCPTLHTGETVVLVRYPHAGKFELPQLVVNNDKNTDAKRTIGPSATDAIGINHKVAEQLSGADFDGDSVLVIPVKDKHGNRTVGIQTEKPLPGLVSFDPHEEYKGYEGMTRMTKAGTQQEMGKISNLITDMQLKGASTSEIERAVKHSMVVIDAEKHNLDYKRSFIENGIAELKETYQGGKTHGASTIISKAKSVSYVNDRKDYYKLDENGKPIYRETGETYLKPTNIKTIEKRNEKNGVKGLTDEQKKAIRTASKEYDKQVRQYNKAKRDLADRAAKGEDISNITLVVPTAPEPIEGIRFKVAERKLKSTKMFEESDATKLVSENARPMEYLYANYANHMKDLANKARLEAKKWNDNGSTYNPTSAKTYASEVESLNKKLKEAQKNAPRERQAQIIAGAEIAQKKLEKPELYDDADALKKVTQQALSRARITVGAKKEQIKLTEKEFEAIQAGAIKKTKLKEILENCDSDRLRELATPKKAPKALTMAQKSRIKAMRNAGWTIQDIADELGVSTSTISNIITG